MPNNSVNMPNNSVNMPNNAINMPNNAINMPNNAINMPNNAINMPNNSVNMPNNAINMPNNAINMPNNTGSTDMGLLSAQSCSDNPQCSGNVNSFLSGQVDSPNLSNINQGNMFSENTTYHDDMYASLF